MNDNTYSIQIFACPRFDGRLVGGSVIPVNVAVHIPIGTRASVNVLLMDDGGSVYGAGAIDVSASEASKSVLKVMVIAKSGPVSANLKIVAYLC